MYAAGIDQPAPERGIEFLCSFNNDTALVPPHTEIICPLKQTNFSKVLVKSATEFWLHQIVKQDH